MVNQLITQVKYFSLIDAAVGMILPILNNGVVEKFECYYSSSKEEKVFVVSNRPRIDGDWLLDQYINIILQSPREAIVRFTTATDFHREFQINRKKRQPEKFI